MSEPLATPEVPRWRGARDVGGEPLGAGASAGIDPPDVASAGCTATVIP